MLDFLYDDIGGKIKRAAKWTFILEAVGAIITGIASLLFGEDDEMLLGIALIFLGPITAWIASWLMYAFGSLVQDVSVIRKKIAPELSASPTFQRVEQPVVAKEVRKEASSTLPRCEFCDKPSSNLKKYRTKRKQTEVYLCDTCAKNIGF